MLTTQFNSKIHVREETFQSKWSDMDLKNEPMLFNCDIESARRLGGPITQNFLDNCPKDILNNKLVIDSRVHMLMPTWYPCIPGYHHDDVWRNPQKGNQPDYVNPRYFSKHVMGMVNAHVAPTHFAIGTTSDDYPLEAPKGKNLYQIYHDLVIRDIKNNQLDVIHMQDGKYVMFDANSFHTGTQAVSTGWRWFIRMSWDTDRVNQCTNELRRQVQVYLPEPTIGW